MFIIMVGKQMFNNFVEFLLPRIKLWWRRNCSSRRNGVADDNIGRDVGGSRGSGREAAGFGGSGGNQKKRWESDFALEEIGDLGLFNEYLEMVSG